MGDLFSVRSTEALAGLTALEEVLRENIALEPDVAKFNKTFEDLNKTTNRLVEQFNNLNKEIGRALVTGLVGGENFNDALQKIVASQDGILSRTEKIFNLENYF